MNLHSMAIFGVAKIRIVKDPNRNNVDVEFIGAESDHNVAKINVWNDAGVNATPPEVVIEELPLEEISDTEQARAEEDAERVRAAAEGFPE